MLTKELEYLMKTLSFEGLKYKKEIMGFSWTRKKEDREEKIIIGYRTFHPNMFRLDIPSIYLSFDSVECILEECIKRHSIQKTWGNASTIHCNLNEISDIDYDMFEIKISDEKDFRSVVTEIIKLIKNGAIPFFEKYKTLENVAELLAMKKPQEVVPYIQGAILFPKTILILKLAKHPLFKKKLFEYWTVLKEQAEKKEIYKQMLIIYNDLFQDDI